MIPQAAITHWSRIAPWPSRDQVEQDLVLSRLICEIANDELLGREMVFRGGTCLHKLHLPEPLRYSEDLDYVRASHGPIGPVFDALRMIADQVGMKVGTDVSQYPKALLRSEFESGAGRLQVKIEINTYETSPARPHIRLPYRVNSSWWTGDANVLTFQPAELVATKLRALYQRRKGRDLFDLWLALTAMALDPNDILSAFGPYRPDGYTAAAALANWSSTSPTPASASTLLTSSGERPSTSPRPGRWCQSACSSASIAGDLPPFAAHLKPSRCWRLRTSAPCLSLTGATAYVPRTLAGRYPAPSTGNLRRPPGSCRRPPRASRATPRLGVAWHPHPMWRVAAVTEGCCW